MKKMIAVVCAAQMAMLAACTSSTVIRSQPTGARVFLNGEYVGRTPYVMSDQKIVGSSTTVKLQRRGYAPTIAQISRNEQFDAGACIGGLFLLFPFLWIEGYKPSHNYLLTPARQGAAPGQTPAASRWSPPPQ